MAAIVMRSTDFPSIVAPILNKSFDGIYDQRKDEYLAFTREEPGIERSYHEEPVLFGMGAAPEWPDGTPVPYQAGGQLFVARYQYKVYGTAFAITRVLAEDGDHIRIGKVFSEHAAQAVQETLETNMAQILNRAFNSAYPGGDGVSLCSPAHSIIGGFYSNQVNSAAMSQTSVEAMITAMMQAVDDTGKKISVIPENFVVPPQQVLQAEVIVRSVLRTGTANNDINPLNTMNLFPGGVKKVSRLTSGTAYFITAGNIPNGIKRLTRGDVQKSMEGDFETDSMRYKIRHRYGQGWTSPRYIFGNQGL
jgi:hypothetical protein